MENTEIEKESRNRKDAYEQLCEAREALIGLFIVICHSFKIDRLVEWIAVSSAANVDDGKQQEAD